MPHSPEDLTEFARAEYRKFIGRLDYLKGEDLKAIGIDPERTESFYVMGYLQGYKQSLKDLRH